MLDAQRSLTQAALKVEPVVRTCSAPLSGIRELKSGGLNNPFN